MTNLNLTFEDYRYLKNAIKRKYNLNKEDIEDLLQSAILNILESDVKDIRDYRGLILWSSRRMFYHRLRKDYIIKRWHPQVLFGEMIKEETINNPFDELLKKQVIKEASKTKYKDLYNDIKIVDKLNKTGYNLLCLTTGELFQSIKDAEKLYNTSNICNNLSGQRKSAGKMNGHKLIWKKL